MSCPKTVPPPTGPPNRPNIPDLPVEVLRDIVRLATHVPDAFETSWEFVLGENRNDTGRLIIESIHTKLSLSLVSKEFHRLVGEYLYEVLFLARRFDEAKLNRLVATLCVNPRDGLRPRGERVRRLDVYIRIPDPWHTFKEDADTLWGLLPACPNLEALYLRPLYPKPAPPADVPTVQGPDETPSRRIECSESFVRNLSETCGQTLRRLDFGETFKMSTDFVKDLFMGMRALEVFYIQEFSLLLSGRAPTKGNDWTETSSGITTDAAVTQVQHVFLGRGYLWFDQEHHVRDLFRAHAASITNLHYGVDEKRPIEVSELLEILPNLEHLCLRVFWSGRWQVAPRSIHVNLRALTLSLAGSLYPAYFICGSAGLKDVALRIHEGQLPALKKIRVEGPNARRYMRLARAKARLNGLGVVCEVQSDEDDGTEDDDLEDDTSESLEDDSTEDDVPEGDIMYIV